MSAIQRLKKILTWTNMSIMVIALSATQSTASIEADKVPHIDQHMMKVIVKQEQSIKRQLGCLARNVYYEANGEPMRGQMAVAQVTVNRARSGLYPRDLCAVVAQSTAVDEDTRVCQFAWYCDRNINKHREIKPWESSYIAAKKVFLEGQRVATLDDRVMYFHRADVKVNPGWSHYVADHIGHHVFYSRTKN